MIAYLEPLVNASKSSLASQICLVILNPIQPTRGLLLEPQTQFQDIRFQTPPQQPNMQPLYPALSKPSPYVYQTHQTQQPPKQLFPPQFPQQTSHLPQPQSLYKTSQSPNQPQPIEPQTQTEITNEYLKELIMLHKIYKDEDKFGGTGDNFNFKVTIFYDKCRRVGLPPNAHIHGASIMLSGQAQTYYYANRGNTSTFDQFCTNHSLKAPSGNVLTSPNGRLLASPISYQQTLLYRQPNAFVNSVPSLIIYKEAWIPHITALYTFARTSVVLSMTGI